MPENRLFEGFHSFAQPNLKGVEKLHKELSKYPEFKPRLTFHFPLDKERTDAIEIVRTGKINEDSVNMLLKSRDFIKKSAGKSLKDLFLKKPYPYATTAVREGIENLLKTGTEEALPVLGQMLLDNSDWSIKVSSAEALSKITDKKTIEILKKADFQELTDKLTFRQREVHHRTIKDAINGVIKNIAEKESEKAIPILEEMCQDVTNVRIPAVRVLTKIIKETKGDEAAGLLKKNFTEENLKMRHVIDFEINKQTWLLGSQKALFATPYTEELVKGLKEVQEINQRLKKKFGDKFIGLVVYGSSAKGYFENSDIDSTFIAKEGIVYDILDFIANGLPERRLVEFHEQLAIDSNNEVMDLFGESAGLFHGIFFGDRKKLVLLQKTLLEKTSENDWDKLREKILDRETENFDKLAERFGLSQEETEKIKLITMLTRTPPTRDETLKIVRRSEKRLNKTK